MAKKKSIWLTYAWDDNEDSDVDFVAQELEKEGLEVKLDRWNISSGKRLWEQIEYFIQDPSKSDGWLFYATQASLGSEKCKEEYYYALDRALETRGGNFPVIALFPSTIEKELIPAGIRIRLYVTLKDSDWKERIIASVENRKLNILKKQISPYEYKIHDLDKQQCDERYSIELRPRAGTWSPFFVAIPLIEKSQVSPSLNFGPANRVTLGGVLFGAGEGKAKSKKGPMWKLFATNEATPTQSYYLLCKELPSHLIFGVDGGKPQYELKQ